MRQATRAIAVFLLLAVLEVVRQSTHVHALVRRDFTAAGLSNIPASIFDLPAESVPAWLTWMGVLTLCFVGVTELCVRAFGASLRAVVASATLNWLSLFVASWLAFVAFGMASRSTVAIALCGAFVESVVLAATAVFWPLGRADETTR